MTAICFYTGASTLIVLGAFAIILIADFIRECIVNLRWRYKYKHRFDKKPIAKCYCIDCSYHDKNGRCSNLSPIDGPSRYTGDNWFCWEANPRKNKEKHDD